MDSQLPATGMMAPLVPRRCKSKPSVRADFGITTKRADARRA
ncbi:hypothetical protein [Candidatus Thiodictyon syntrophicum]|nr:hypothetical protein [Candidatus Thiodictyon syntrophicum]